MGKRRDRRNNALQNYNMSTRVLLILVSSILINGKLTQSLSSCGSRSSQNLMDNLEIFSLEVRQCDLTRKDFMSLWVAFSGVIFSNPLKAEASNLPPSTGADLSKTSSAEKLAPILVMKADLDKAQKILIENQSPSSIQQLLEQLKKILENSIPDDEKAFKRIFDEYSQPVSYKQKYMDSNAFLIYYTKGFDGVGRPSIESGDEIPLQTLQYGARNECWTSYDDLFTEIKFGIKDGTTEFGELKLLLDKSISSWNNYVGLAPRPTIEKAEELLRN